MSSSDPSDTATVTFDQLRRALNAALDIWESGYRVEPSKSIFSDAWNFWWPSASAATPAPTIEINPGVVIATEAVNVLRDLLIDAGLTAATITSGQRTVEQQARAMYTNLVTLGVPSQRALYRDSGDKVIDEFERASQAGMTPDQVRAAMVTKIIEVGPTNVSNHIDPRFHTFDVANSSIEDGQAFVAALERAKEAGRVSAFIVEGKAMAFHVEVARTVI
jgi:hypothetical protein